MAKKRYLYWGGFCDDVLEHGTLPAIFSTKKEAKKVYKDVRRVEIVETKKVKSACEKWMAGNCYGCGPRK